MRRSLKPKWPDGRWRRERERARERERERAIKTTDNTPEGGPAVLGLESFQKWCPQNFWLPPPCPHLDLIYTIKFTQPPLLCLLFHDPPPPSDAIIKCGSSLTWFVSLISLLLFSYLLRKNLAGRSCCNHPFRRGVEAVTSSSSFSCTRAGITIIFCADKILPHTFSR